MYVLKFRPFDIFQDKTRYSQLRNIRKEFRNFNQDMKVFHDEKDGIRKIKKKNLPFLLISK